MASAPDIRAGRAFVELVVRDKLAAGLKAAAAKLQSYSRTFAAAGGAMLGGAAAIATPLIAAATNFASTGAALDDISQRTGMSVEALSELGYAAEQSGTNLEAIEKASKKLAKTVTDAADGSKSARESFAGLGLSWAEVAAKSPDDQLEAVADGLAGISDPARRAALAQEVLGKSGTDLIPMLSGGAAGMRQLRDEAKRLGLTVSGDTAAKAAVLDDSLASLGAVVKDAWFEIGSGMAPAITTLSNALRSALVPINAFIERNGELLQIAIPVAAGMAAIGVALLGIAGALQLGSFLLSGLAGAAGLLLSPWTLLIAAVAGGVYAWTRFSASGKAALGSLRGFFGPLLTTARGTIQGIVDAFKAGNLQLAAQIALAGLKTVFLTGLQQLVTLFPTALGPLGDWLAKMGAELAAGRWAELGQTAMAGLRAAFDAGLAGLRLLWGTFTRGIVSALATAAKSVAEIWTKAVSGIANGLLELASSSKAAGTLLAPILGVNMYEEKQRYEKTNDARARGYRTANLAHTIAESEKKLRTTLSNQERMKLQAAIEQWKSELAAVDSPAPDFLAGARDSVDRSLTDANANIDAALNSWTETANAQAAESQAAAQQQLANAMAGLTPAGAGGGAALAAGLTDAQRELQAGLTQAAAERAAAEAKAKAGQKEAVEELAPVAAGGGPKIAGTFSAWAIGQQFGPADTVAIKQLAEQKRMVTISQRMLEIAETQERRDAKRKELVYT